MFSFLFGAREGGREGEEMEEEEGLKEGGRSKDMVPTHTRLWRFPCDCDWPVPFLRCVT